MPIDEATLFTQVGVPVNRGDEEISPGEFSVIVHSTATQFDALKSRWQQLMTESDATLFQSYEWQRTWWKHYGETHPTVQLHIVTIEKSGRLLAIAPFFIESVKRLGVVRITQLSFIAEDATDYLDIIIAKGYERECIGILASHISDASKDFDFLHLIDMPERSGHHALLYAELERLGFAGVHFVNEHCPRATLLPTWDATIASFSSSKRASLKRVQKKVTADFDVELQLVSDRSALPEGFAEFVRLHQKRWNEIGQLGVFADPRAGAFHRELAETAFDQGWLFLGFLLLNGKRCAAIYGFIYKKQFFYYLSGIDMTDNLEKYSLGRVLHLYSIYEVVKRGVEVYDFMRGTERYKYDFNGIDSNNWTILAYPKTHRLAGLKFRIALLADSLNRRFYKERFLWRQRLGSGKILSGRSLVFVVERIITNIKDGLQKVKTPEKSLTLQDATGGKKLKQPGDGNQTTRS